jgi:crossover junction endodeoxyribonuclease RusA
MTIVIRRIRHSFAVIGVPVSSQSSKESRKRYQQLVAQEAAKSVKSPIKDNEKVKIEIDWFSEGFENKPDADNIAKPIIDALKGIVFPDDKQVESHTIRKHDVLGVIRFDMEPLSIVDPLLNGNNDYVFIRIY